MNPKVDFFFNKDTKWQKEYDRLRTIILDCGLNEDLKWGCPCYTNGKSNIVLIHGFKEYCALLFFKGSLMTDADNLLIRQTENVQAARQMRFTSLEQIAKLEPKIKAYVLEAAEIEKKGLKVELKKTTEFKMPEEFRAMLNDDASLKEAFEKLTPGRQRAYLLHFTTPKTAKTRESRIANAIPQILDGKGLDD